jgi:cytochrome c-type biogenesis protein CcmH
MTSFLALASLCGAAALLFVLRPWLQALGTNAPRARLVPVIATLLVLLGGVALYVQLSNWPWQSPPQASPASQAVAGLLRATREQPQDQQAWLQLGQAYLQLEQFPLARRAFERANQLAAGNNAAALTGLAETVVLSGDTANNARAAELFERALQIDPRSGKALFYTALTAMQSGDLRLARDRFATMLTLEAPDDVRQALTKQIAALDAQLQQGSAANATSAIRIRVTIDPALANSIPAGASLFVFVRNGAGGAPLAVRRLAATFPQRVNLSSADSMIEGSEVQPGQRVKVVARISRTGSPTAQPGDVAGEIDYVAGKDGERELIIRP